MKHFISGFKNRKIVKLFPTFKKKKTKLYIFHKFLQKSGKVLRFYDFKESIQNIRKKMYEYSV